jgi:hypothetical protein
LFCRFFRSAGAASSRSLLFSCFSAAPPDSGLLCRRPNALARARARAQFCKEFNLNQGGAKADIIDKIVAEVERLAQQSAGLDGGSTSERLRMALERIEALRVTRKEQQPVVSSHFAGPPSGGTSQPPAFQHQHHTHNHQQQQHHHQQQQHPAQWPLVSPAMVSPFQQHYPQQQQQQQQQQHSFPHAGMGENLGQLAPIVSPFLDADSNPYHSKSHTILSQQVRSTRDNGGRPFLVRFQASRQQLDAAKQRVFVFCGDMGDLAGGHKWPPNLELRVNGHQVPLRRQVRSEFGVRVLVFFHSGSFFFPLLFLFLFLFPLDDSHSHSRFL